MVHTGGKEKSRQNKVEETLGAGIYVSAEKLQKHFSREKLKLDYFKKNLEKVRQFLFPTYSCNDFANHQSRKDFKHKEKEKKKRGETKI